jgi:hypothetical protein
MARLSLEHFKLLTARSPALEMGTGGKPDITFQEVSDVLAFVSDPCRIYARWHYSMDRDYRQTMSEILMVKVLADEQAREIVAHWAGWWHYVELALLMHQTGADLTKKQRASEVRKRWWRKSDDRKLRIVQLVLDEWDYEIRRAIADWNYRLSVTECDAL